MWLTCPQAPAQGACEILNQNGRRSAVPQLFHTWVWPLRLGSQPHLAPFTTSFCTQETNTKRLRNHVAVPPTFPSCVHSSPARPSVKGTGYRAAWAWHWLQHLAKETTALPLVGKRQSKEMDKKHDQPDKPQCSL